MELFWLLVVVVIAFVAIRMVRGSRTSGPGATAGTAAASASRAQCPMCEGGASHHGRVDRSHWGRHVARDDAGNYTFTCPRCGPSPMYWNDSMAAECGVGVHLMQRHGCLM